uniref:Mesenchymal stem cell protein DSCD28 n=1 Tax=Homo sapiens TaxID=9606 RepID=Q9NYI3_HUMAN|nr:mesenchymal stem cell protein DSCD28 [Homo sapiens]
MFHCMYIPYFAYSFTFHGHLGCFYLVGTVNHAAINIGVQIYVPASAFNSFAYIPRS